MSHKVSKYTKKSKQLFFEIDVSFSTDDKSVLLCVVLGFADNSKTGLELFPMFLVVISGEIQVFAVRMVHLY